MKEWIKKTYIFSRGHVITTDGGVNTITMKVWRRVWVKIGAIDLPLSFRRVRKSGNGGDRAIRLSVTGWD